MKAVLDLIKAYGRIIRFIVAGGTGAVVNLSVLFVLVQHFNWYPVWGSVGSFVCAFFVSFTLQKLWTYRNFSKDEAAQQMGVYLGIQIMNLGINTVFMYVFVEFTPIHYLVAQIITSAIIAIESYFLYKHIVFKKQQEETQVV